MTWRPAAGGRAAGCVSLCLVPTRAGVVTTIQCRLDLSVFNSGDEVRRTAGSMVNDGEVQETRQPAVKLEEDNGNRRQPTVGMGAWTGIGEFHEQDGETWADYIERFEFACIGQGVEMDDVTKRARLLSGLGQEGFRKVKTILAHEGPCRAL